jgi:chorismate mutase
MLVCRGIRGATTTQENTDTEIYAATRELLAQLIDANQIDQENVAAAYFTVTTDLDAAYPAAAARQLGWNSTALMCSTEIPVPGSLPRCIRVMLLYNTEKSQLEMVNIYLNGTDVLRLQGVEST